MWKYNVQFTLTGPTPTWAFRSRSRVGRPPCPSSTCLGRSGRQINFLLITLGLQTILSRDFAFSIALVLELSWNLMTEIHSPSKCGARKNINKAAIPYIKPEFLAENTFLAHGISSALNTRVFLRLVWLPVQPQRARRKRKGRKQWGSAAFNKHSHAETGKKDPPGGRTENYSCATNATQIHSSWIF